MAELHFVRRFLIILSLVLFAVGCDSSARSSSKGDAEVIVSTRSALSAADVARMHLTISGPGIAPAIESDLVSSGGSWRAVIGHIPAGDQRMFHADAFDAAGTVIYTGDAGPVTVTDGVTALVALVLRPVQPPAPFANATPVIDSATASTTTIAPSGTVSLTATAHDPNPLDVLKYKWTATAGTFGDDTKLNTTWTAPATTGDQTLTLRVTDNHKAVVALSITIHVAIVGSGGSVDFSSTINSWPVIQAIIADPGRLQAGETAQLYADVVDADDMRVNYYWSTSCDGTFSNPNDPRATFTLNTANGDCDLFVTAIDLRGGQNTGTLTISTGPAPIVAETGSIITSSAQSSTWALEGDVVTFSVTSSSDATFGWTSAAGALGAGSSATRSSQIAWTAPACAHGLAPDVTVTVTDTATGAAFPYTFPLTVYCATPVQTFGIDVDAIYGVSGGPNAATWSYQNANGFDPALGALKKVRVTGDITWTFRDGATSGSTPPVDHEETKVAFFGVWERYQPFECNPNTTRSDSWVQNLDVVDDTPWKNPLTFYQVSITNYIDHHVKSAITLSYLYEP